MLEVNGLSYGKLLEGISFKVPEGAVVGILGPNGAGKSTFLKCLGGFYRYGGSVRLNGQELREVPLRVRWRLVNYLPQLINFQVPYTVEELLSFYGPRGKVLKALKRLGIEGLKGQLFERLSGGERVKVLLARLLVIEPQLYLLDEPSAFLDLSLIPLLSELIEEAVKEGRVVLVVSHDFTFLSSVSRFFLGIKGGRQLFFREGPPSKRELEELFEVPLEIFSAKKAIFVRPKKSKGGEE